jgi:cytochrome P450
MGWRAMASNGPTSTTTGAVGLSGDALGAFSPWSPHPRTRMPNHLSTLYFLHRNPIRLLTRRHYSEPFVRNRMFGLSAVFLNDPDLIRHVFVDGRTKYGIDPIRKLLLSRNFGQGIATVEGTDWHDARKAASPYFTSSKLKEYAATFVDVARAHCCTELSGGPVPLVGFIADITFECAMRCLFSFRGDATFHTTIESSSICMEKGMTFDLMDIWRLPMSIPRLLKKSVATYQERYRGHVEAMLRARNERISEAAAGLDDLMTGYQNQYLSNGTQQGRTAALDNMRAVLEEVDGARGATDPHLWPTKLPRTLAVIRETLRVYPTLPAISRYALDDDEIDGYRIGKGEFVVANIWAMHRDRRHWHRACDYLPDRFLPDGDGASNAARYMPFGIGPRSCIGRHFAEIEAVIVLATLLRNLEFIPCGGKRPQPVWRGTLRADNGIPMVLAQRRHS